ncbi:hypothetical protein FOA43_002365 [Brettanomyces nanus]|uniref:SCP domain-containing protein n=1 Tax=Eeniella nana TaxID=13502 RepID=A0A875S3S7_EENNA|nr:uncharacterized protein FOA43_002365 [Brettanomyces nanus]QPG75025.1 hypothetical protein FOA43_002365 [Brettanomyces nanus]
MRFSLSVLTAIVAVLSGVSAEEYSSSEECQVNYHTVTSIEYVYTSLPVETTKKTTSSSTFSPTSTISSQNEASATLSSASSIALSGPSNIASSQISSTLDAQSTTPIVTPTATSSILSSSPLSSITTSTSPLPTSTLPTSKSTSISTTSKSTISTSISSISPVTSSPVTSSTPTSSTPTTSTPISTSSVFSFEDVYLDRHNYYRNLHVDTPAMSWDDGVANVAQTYADSYDCDGVLTHSGNSYNGSSLGENLAYGYDFYDAGAVDAWYDEISNYNYSDPQFAEDNGHFTQLVWKSSTRLGCGYKYCSPTYGYYIVCNYQPAGNVIYSGDEYKLFKENVLPLKSSS